MLIVLRQMLLDAMLFLALSFIFYVGFLQAFYVRNFSRKCKPRATLHHNQRSNVSHPLT